MSTEERDDLPTAADWSDLNGAAGEACCAPHDETAEAHTTDDAPEASATVASDEAPATADSSEENTDSSRENSEPATDNLDNFDDPLADSELANALSRIEELEDQLARAKADHYNLNTEYGNYVRRAKEAIPTYKSAGHVDVLEALIGVLDDIDAARQAGDLNDGPFASIAQKLEDTLSTKFQLTRYGAVGDDFDPTLHEALMARPNPEVDHEVIGQVLQPGYTMGEQTLRVAKVLVDNPA